MGIFKTLDKLLGGKKFNFSVGYQLPGETNGVGMVEIFRKYKSKLSETFFSMPLDIGGRFPQGVRSHLNPDQQYELFFKELEEISALGMTGVLLFNASCYGGDVSSYRLFDHIKRSVEEVRKHINLTAVTTMSMTIAKYIKDHYPDLRVRSSVNMHIGSLRQMEAIRGYFDGYYLNRDYNRNLEHIRMVRKWCDDNGKSLHMLANSGCLYECPYHIFHQNIVAHIMDIQNTPSVCPEYPSPCLEIMSDPAKQHWVLQNTWVRPEDLHHYEGLFDTIKLATRQSAMPERTIQAYTEGKWDGDLLDLLEPGFGYISNMPIVENKRFPEDWFEHTTHCKRQCLTCNYCKSVFETVRRNP